MKKTTIFSLLIALLASGALAKDFKLQVLPQAKNPMFDMTEVAPQTYYTLVKKQIGPAMLEAGAGGASNETKLRTGKGVSVKLGEHNYNVHINYPNSEMGGRSYGWTSGKVGDWSDAMYLRSLSEVMDRGNEADIKSFYKVVVKMLGKSSPEGLESLNADTQRVATNFLAIYTAEAYRRDRNPNTKWDDALMQITLLGAFHGGQETFEMYYVGKFTDETKEKGPGVYNRGKRGQLYNQANEKEADMEDYHQFSFKTPDEEGSNRSGINLTRNDFQKLGTAITKYKENSENLAKIREIIDMNGKNVYADLAEYFAEGKARVADADKLANAVSAFMIETFDDADKISKSLH